MLRGAEDGGRGGVGYELNLMIKRVIGIWGGRMDESVGVGRSDLFALGFGPFPFFT